MLQSVTALDRRAGVGSERAGVGSERAGVGRVWGQRGGCGVRGHLDDRNGIAARMLVPEPDPWPGRLLTGAVWAALAACAVPLVRRGTLRYCFARWPYVFGVALGLAWWLWLRPSILGLAIVLAVLFRLFYR